MRRRAEGLFSGRRSTVLYLGLAAFCTGYVLEIDLALLVGILVTLAAVMVWDELRRVGRWLEDLRIRAEILAIKRRTGESTLRGRALGRLPFAGRSTDRSADASSDPFEDLRERYADDELTHEQFERLVERRMADEGDDRPESTTRTSGRRTPREYER